MLPATRAHEAYLQFVKQQLATHYGESLIFLQDFYADLIFWVIPIDLSRTAFIMKDGYSVKTKGRKPRDPANMLRSILLMTKLQYSVDDWVHQLRTIPIYAILSGFSPGDVPSIGTFYDFFRRLWNADSPHKTGRKKRKLKKPKKKGKKNEKQEPKNPGITEKLVARAMRSDSIHYSPKAHDRLMALFQQMFVLPSAEKGLLGNTASFSVIGDGSPDVTGARAYGKFLCKCRFQGNWKCECKRQFADPDADWGWDSYRERYYFGRTLYMFCAADSPYNLPVYPRLFRASTHDMVSWVCGYRELLHWYPQWKLGEAILDSAHDAFPITMVEHDDVSSIIDLNPRRSGITDDITFGTVGVPTCPILW
ncbi:transposase [Ferviditalea candida]|uniref:Transposase n=1 Tax=Ferviditalea candida TaxID=3108399 RepID=A0ABU5ZNK5_9BACL|nr:transposase [Paenibacillaceae bacterium T2]